jgi:FdhD protein
MDDSKAILPGIRQVRAHRLSTDRGSGLSVAESVWVVVEAPLTLDVQGVDAYTLLCTPGDTLPMVYGFLYSEGVIDSPADVASCRPCRDDPAILRVTLTSDGPRIGDPGRNLLIVSSCGACGHEDLQTRLDAMHPVDDTLRIHSSLLQAPGRAVQEKQVLFESCGGTHAAGIFTREGQILACAEDTGRHNALDKAIGKCLLDGVSTAGCGAVLSGRISLEMVGKCARAGIELITAISAPTSLALDVAEPGDGVHPSQAHRRRLAHHNPISFHQKPPIPSQMIRCTTLIRMPSLHQSPRPTYPAPKNTGAGPLL